jgi:hypothetical protein
VLIPKSWTQWYCEKLTSSDGYAIIGP